MINEDTNYISQNVSQPVPCEMAADNENGFLTVIKCGRIITWDMEQHIRHGTSLIAKSKLL